MTHVMAERGYRGVKPLTARPIRRSCRDGASNARIHRREPPPRQAELLCSDLVPGVRRIETAGGERRARLLVRRFRLQAPALSAVYGPVEEPQMTSPYLDRPLLPLAVALPRMLAEIETALATAGPVETRRLRQRADLIRELLTPRPTEPLST